MLEIYHWTLKRSGKGMTIFGIGVESGKVNALCKVAEVETIYLSTIDLKIFALRNNVPVAVLKTEPYTEGK